jgi:hypothetical protein
MALTTIQRDICRLLAADRRARGESYVAGGVALSVALDAQRLSRDVDLFHDSLEAVARSWDHDRRSLEAAGYTVAPLRERPGFVEASVRRHDDEVVVEWTRDSAFRFFPLVEHEILGLTLHPFDLATNKILALVGRLEPRDWVDAVSCHERVQPLGYLLWAACGKDPGFTPQGLLAHAGRTNRYSDEEIRSLAFDGPPPDAGLLARQWHTALDDAREILSSLPTARAGQAVLSADAHLYQGTARDLPRDLERERVLFHAGRLGGAWPRVREG